MVKVILVMLSLINGVPHTTVEPMDSWDHCVRIAVQYNESTRDDPNVLATCMVIKGTDV